MNKILLITFFSSYREYFPQNIMHDRRIMRGSTYAAMVIPAGTNPDAMVMDKNYPKKRTFKRPTVVSFSYFILNF